MRAASLESHRRGGRIAGRFNVGRHINLKTIPDTHVYAILRDDLDVQYLVEYRIVPGPLTHGNDPVNTGERLESR
jgi:hypothetical protein